MSFAATIVNTATKWYRKNCIETSANRGPCVDLIHTAFDADWIRSKRSEAWCAKFVWVVYEESAQQHGISNPLPQTAGARDLLNRSKAAGSLSVDSTPRVGSVFYRRSESAGSSGHVGIVSGVNNDGFTTIEGNLSNRVGLYKYSYGDIPAMNFSFIHGQDQHVPGALIAGGSTLTWLLLGSVAAGALYTFMRKG